MTILERLKLELNKQSYFEDTEYEQFLSENSLTSADTYDKSVHERALLLTVVDVLEAVANDVDIMSSLTTEFGTITSAYNYLENRIAKIKDRIATIPDTEAESEEPIFNLMFTRG